MTSLFALSALLLAAIVGAPPPDPGTLPAKVEAQGLPNLYRLHDKVLSGGQPEGEIAFQELARLGVKTVISVDGATPNVALAKKYGLRYVHLPHGYDGVPEQRGQELAKAVRDLPGPIYIHCHHGKHRSPAAAAIACVEAGLLPAAAAAPFLRTAGTSENYRGLYQSVESARRLEKEVLDALQVDYPETAKLPAMAQAMVQVEHHHDHLKLIAKEGWRAPANHPALVPAHEALLLREHFTELLRADEVKKQPVGFRQLTQESEAAALELEAALAAGKENRPAATAAFDRVTHKCAACHKTYRDVPLREKGVK